MNDRSRLYLYPMDSEQNIKPSNPYRYNIIKTLSSNFKIANFGSPSHSPAKDFFTYFFKADIFYFNWIEDISWKGTLVFPIFLFLAKLFGKKVCWTHHNLHSHKGRTASNSFMTYLLKTFSDYIVVHTEASYSALKISKESSRVLYFFHPFFATSCTESTKSESLYDLLIWGNVRRSKGVDSFLQYLKDREHLDSYSILVIGKFETNQYYADFKVNFENGKVIIKNSFITEDELNLLHDQSKYIFFPYTGSSVLNSGALITSLPKGTPIIGPCAGSFEEVGKRGLIQNYKTFDDVMKILQSDKVNYPMNDINDFVSKYTWPKFSNFLAEKLK